jgi:translation initiation factor 2B subunit (eIF-2B alpha/beta/delta family)
LRGILLCCGILIAAWCLAPTFTPAQHGTGSSQGETGVHGSIDSTLDDSRVTNIDGLPTLTAKQKQALMQVNLSKSKKDAAELAALARQLREELDKPDANTLSLESMNRIDRIEKLAKRIREEMKGF